MNQQIDAYWERYMSLYSFESVLHKYRVRNAVEFLESSTPLNRDVLEVGCGFHPLFEVYSRFRSFTAVEPGARAFAAITELAGNDRRIRLHQCFLQDALPALVKSRFDAIVISAVLQEVPNPAEFLRSVRQLMNETTVAYVNVSNATSLHRILGLKMGILTGQSSVSERAKELGQYRSYSTPNICDLIVSAIPDATIVDSGTFFLKPFTHEQMMACLESDIIDESVLEALYTATDLLPDSGSELFVTFRARNT